MTSYNNSNILTDSVSLVKEEIEIPGYDTIAFRLEQYDAPDIDFMGEFPCLMKNRKDTFFPNGAIKACEGFVEGFHVTAYPHMVKISGSLVKLLNGHNIAGLRPDHVAGAIKKLSSLLLNLPLEKALIYRIDIATTFLMCNPFQDYTKLFIRAPRFYQEDSSDTKYFFNSKNLGKLNSNIILLFYNKEQWFIDKKIELPFPIKNTLRYEMRLRRLSRLLGQRNICPADLADEAFFQRLIDLYKKHFFSIATMGEINQHPRKYTSKSFMLYTALKSFLCDGLGNTLGSIDELPASKAQVWKIKKDVINLCNDSDLTSKSQLITELENKIQRCS